MIREIIATVLLLSIISNVVLYLMYDGAANVIVAQVSAARDNHNRARQVCQSYGFGEGLPTEDGKYYRCWQPYTLVPLE